MMNHPKLPQPQNNGIPEVMTVFQYIKKQTAI